MTSEPTDVARKLDALAKLREAMSPKAEALDEQIESLQEERATILSEDMAEAEALEASIKADILRTGATVRGEKLIATFVSGRVTWDSKALDGYAAAHPEIEKFRKAGEPSARISLVR